MKRVAYFTDLGSPARTGGGQTFARELFAALDALPVELTVFSAFYPKFDEKLPIDSPKVHPITLPSLRTFGIPEVGIPWSLKLARRLRKMPQQDLYVFDQPATWFSLFPKAPAIAMFHGTDHIPVTPKSFLHPRSLAHALVWQKPVLNRVQRGFLSRRTGTPMFNSRYTLRTIGADYKIDTAPLEQYVTYLPVDTASYARDLASRERIRSQFGIAKDEVVIIYLSNFAHKKRADRVPPIVRGLLQKMPEAKITFMFVGRGLASGPIDTLLNDPLAKGRCIRVEEIEPAAVPQFYSASDIALSTSESETFGYFVAEGMMAELPFVAYAEGSVPEVMEDGGTGLLARSEEEFIEALARLVRDPELRVRMGKAGRARVERLFSRAAFLERFKDILRTEFGL